MGLTLNIPLFSGFSQKSALLKAQALIDQANANYDTLTQEMNTQVWQAYYTLKTAEQNIQTTRELLKSSSKAAQQVYGQYQAGVGNILTVLSTQSALNNARAQSIQAQLNWYTAMAQLSLALGKLYAS